MESGMNKIKVGNLKRDIYIPENCNENTRFIVYYNGDGQDFRDRQTVIDELNKNGSDAIVLFESIGNYADVNNTINQVAAEYNIKDINVTPIGYSIGSYFSTNEMLQVLKDNPDTSPQVLMHLDGYNVNLGSIFKKNAQTLIDNDSIVITAYRQGDKYKHLQDYKDLASYGVNVLFLTYKGEDAKSHDQVNSDFFTKGNLDFLAGTGELSDIYEVNIYDKETGTFKKVDLKDINNLNKLYDYFGMNTYDMALKRINSLTPISFENLSLKSDSKILSDPLNKIIVNVKNTAYIKNSSNSESSFSSTTQMPSQVPQIVNEYFSVTVELLSKIANDISQFTKIGPLIDKIDRDLANQAVQALQLNPNNTTSESTLLNTNLTNSEVNNDKEKNTEETLTVPITPNLNNDSQFTTLAGTTGAIGMAVGAANTIKGQQTQSKDTINIITPSRNQPSNSPAYQPNSGITKPTNKPLVPQTAPSNNQANSGGNPINNNETHPLEQFPKYEEVYSDETKIVYNCNDEYKVIIHKDGDKIIGIEHYYDFGTESSANQSLNNLKLEYQNTEHMENIMQQGRYVKVVFSEEMYHNLTINQVKQNYSNLEEINKI